LSSRIDFTRDETEIKLQVETALRIGRETENLEIELQAPDRVIVIQEAALEKAEVPK